MDLDIDFTEIVQKEINFNNLQTLNCNISLKENQEAQKCRKSLKSGGQKISPLPSFLFEKAKWI